jgi:SAM-dependent methyltransferase
MPKHRGPMKKKKKESGKRRFWEAYWGEWRKGEQESLDYVDKFVELNDYVISNLMKAVKGVEKARILEVGAGPHAKFARRVRESVPRSDVVPMDIVEPHSREEELGFIVSDIAELGADSEYDASFSVFTLSYCRPRRKALESIWRALKPGGKAVFLLHTRNSALQKVNELKYRRTRGRVIFMNKLYQLLRDGHVPGSVSYVPFSDSLGFGEQVGWAENLATYERLPEERKEEILPILKEDIDAKAKALSYAWRLMKIGGRHFGSTEEVSRLFERSGFKIRDMRLIKVPRSRLGAFTPGLGPQYELPAGEYELAIGVVAEKSKPWAERMREEQEERERRRVEEARERLRRAAPETLKLFREAQDSPDGEARRVELTDLGKKKKTDYRHQHYRPRVKKKGKS